MVMPCISSTAKDRMTFTIGTCRESESILRDTSESLTSRGENPPFNMDVSAIGNNKFSNASHDGVCPCCSRKHCIDPNRVVVFKKSSTHYQHYGSLFQVQSEDSNDDDTEDLDNIDRMFPGVLALGTAYRIKSVVFHGYLDKKGSGFDWIGSKAWKPRWAVLVKARTDGHEVDVPLLQIFWDYHSPSPSTVISLDSAVILPDNNLGDDKRNSKRPFRFKIYHVKKSVNPESSLQITRIFSCSGEVERDEWVYSINQALLNYEKEKASAKRLSSLSLSVSHGLIRSWIKDDVMPQTKPNRQRKFSPPLIPP